MQQKLQFLSFFSMKSISSLVISTLNVIQRIFNDTQLKKSKHFITIVFH